MAASLSRTARETRSMVNKAANRIVREEPAFNMAVAMIAVMGIAIGLYLWLQRKAERWMR